MDNNISGTARIVLARHLNPPARVFLGISRAGAELAFDAVETRPGSQATLHLLSPAGEELEVAADQPVLILGVLQ